METSDVFGQEFRGMYVSGACMPGIFGPSRVFNKLRRSMKANRQCCQFWPPRQVPSHRDGTIFLRAAATSNALLPAANLLFT